MSLFEDMIDNGLSYNTIKKKKERKDSLFEDMIDNNMSYNDSITKRNKDIEMPSETTEIQSNINEIDNKTEEKNFFQKIGEKILFPLKTAGSGALSGTTGIAQAGLTDSANEMNKGKEKENTELGFNFIDSLLGLINPTYGATKSLENAPDKIKEIINTLSNKNKNTTEKITDIGLNATDSAINDIPVKNLLNSTNQIIGKVSQNSGENVLDINDKISQPSKKVQEYINKEAEKQDDFTRLLGNATQSVGNMLPSVTASIISGSPSVGLAVMGASVKGQSTQEALDKGEDLEKAVKIGNTKAMIEIGTEMMSGGLNIFGKGALDDIVTKGIDKKVKNEVANFLLKKGVDIPGEILEETISDILGTIIDKGTVDPNATYSIGDWSDTALTTTLSTVILNALTGGYGKNAYRTNQINMKDANSQIYTDYDTGNVLDKKTQGVLNQAENIIKENNILPISKELKNSTNNLQTQQTIQQENKTAQNLISNQINNNIANNQETLYNNNERESGINERRQDNTRNQGIFGQYDTNIQQENQYKERRYTRQEYEQWEKTIKPINENNITSEQKTIKDNIKRQYNKNIVFFDEKNSNYSAGASLSNTENIYINVEQANEFGLKKMALHEIMESNILHNKQLKEDIIIPTIKKIIQDPNFQQQKNNFWKGQDGNIPSDYAIAKDIIADRFAEIESKESLDYSNVLSQETNMTIDFAINNFQNKIKDVKLPPVEKKKIGDNTPIGTDSFSNSNNYIENNVNIPTKEYFENKKMQEELTDKDYDVINKIYEKEAIEEKIPNNKETNLEKYNKNKAIIIKENEKTINDLISFKNYATNNIETQIKQKQELLKTIAEPERADIIKKQIENLKDKKAKMEEKYNADIDKFNSKNTLEKVEMKARTIMKEEARNIMSAEIEPLVEDLTKYKDKKAGILYNRETAQRNIQDIVKDKELAKTINETIFDPVQVHQAEKTRVINDLFEKINDLEIDKTKKYEYKSEEGPVYKVDEATLAQLLIEKKISDTNLRSYYNLSEENISKIHKIANTFTEILDNLYDQMNEVQIQYGYTPIGKIKNYFPHFFENKTDTTLGKIASYFGTDLTNQDLPTEIAGKTDTFKPGRTWNANIQKRRTNKTDYNALAAMEKYISGAADLIYTTQDIQKIREYSRQIRYKLSDKGMQESIDDIYQNENLSQEAKDAQLEGIFKNTKNELSKFVTWLDDYANGLANKKSFSDRNIEREAGRQIYSTMSSIESRIAANTIGGNLSVSLTNFAPLFQSMGTTKPSYIISGMLQTTKNNIKGLIKGEKDTSFVNNSNFLTNRFGVDSISEKKLTQKISDITSIPMNAIDEFTAESIVRAKYLENLDKGMSEEIALDNADKYSAKIMADRSKGAIPLVFNKKNPIAKLMTMFQVEPNNIVSNYLKDMPRDAKSKTQLAYQYSKLMIASYAFNTMAMAIRGGSEVLPDPIRIVSNLIKMLVEDDDDEKEKAQSDLVDSIVGSTPFLSNAAGLMGMEDIGRIPISNAIPSITNIKKLFDKEADSKYKKEIIEKELSKPLLYLGLPVGGAQLKKTIEGITAVNKGGSYKTNKEGEKQLQFPVENKSAKNYLKAGVFGKWSLDEAQMYTKTLTPKQTKSYEESKIPYKEYLEYLSKNLKKKEDKINYLGEQNWNENQKWGIYKNEILSNTERKEDGGSQLKDAEYIISKGMSKTDFMNLYNKAQLNDIDIPTQKDYKKMERAGISLENYIDYKIKIREKTEDKRNSKELTDSQDLKDKDKIQILLDSDYSNKEISAIYENYIKNTKDTQYYIVKESGIDIKEYLKYKQQDFESDRKDDGTINGKAISKSKQKKEYESVNNMKITYNQKLTLLGMQYSLTSGEKTKLANYVNEMNLNKKEKLEVYEKLKGFKVYKDGRVTW